MTDHPSSKDAIRDVATLNNRLEYRVSIHGRSMQLRPGVRK